MTDKIEDVFVRHIHAYTPSQIADGILAGEFVRETEFVLAHEVERLRTFEAAHRQLLADLDTATRERDEARAEIENLYDQVHRWVDDRAKAQLQADRLREQNYELQRERDEARAEVERLRAENARLRAQVAEYFAEPETHPVEREE